MTNVELTSPSLHVLGYPDFSKTVIKATDASPIALGGTLSQNNKSGRIRLIT